MVNILVFCSCASEPSVFHCSAVLYGTAELDLLRSLRCRSNSEVVNMEKGADIGLLVDSKGGDGRVRVDSVCDTPGGCIVSAGVPSC